MIVSMLGTLPLVTGYYDKAIPCALCVNEIKPRRLFYILYFQVDGVKPEGVHPECARAAIEKVVEIRRARKQGSKPA
jgi:hypothetical protein